MGCKGIKWIWNSQKDLKREYFGVCLSTKSLRPEWGVGRKRLQRVRSGLNLTLYRTSIELSTGELRVNHGYHTGMHRIGSEVSSALP
jgi:hypothetical protein